MQKKTTGILLWALLLVGLAAALLLCGLRGGMELANSRVSLVMTREAAETIGDLPTGFGLYDGGPMYGDAAVLVEDQRQYSYVPDPVLEALLGQNPPAAPGGIPCLRCFHLTPVYTSRLVYPGFSVAEEAEAVLFRAATDRNIRLLWLEPLVNPDGSVVTDSAVYAQLADSLSHRLQRQGLTLGRECSVFPAYTPNGLLLILCGFAVVAAGVLLLEKGFGLRGKWLLPLLIGLCLLCAAALRLMPETAISLLGLAAAILFPCLAVGFGIEGMARAEGGGLGRDLGRCAGSLALGFLIALAGGLLVGALQSSTEWLLALRNFRGVKLSAAAPLLFALYYALRRLCPPRELLRSGRLLLIPALLVLAAAGIVFLLRTGDGALGVSGLEWRLRNALERLLLVRPRTKEFLIAWPCFGLAYALCARGARRYSWPFAILSATGFFSVVNSFCHSRAPLWLSALRGIYGLLPGMALALALAALLHLRPSETGPKSDKI